MAGKPREEKGGRVGRVDWLTLRFAGCIQQHGLSLQGLHFHTGIIRNQGVLGAANGFRNNSPYS